MTELTAVGIRVLSQVRRTLLSGKPLEQFEIDLLLDVIDEVEELMIRVDEMMAEDELA